LGILILENYFLDRVMVDQGIVKRPASLVSALGLMALCIGNSPLFPGFAWAASVQSATPESSRISNKSTAHVTFIPPQRNAPRETRGGASRGEVCASNVAASSAQSLKLLVPTQSSYGLTSSDRPTFFAYVPATSARKLFFSLKNESGVVHYQTNIPITGNGEVVSFTLPETTSALEMGREYEWGIALLCSGKLRPDSPFASGWVQKVALPASLTSQLSTASPLDRAALLGTSGIWYDALATLAQLRQEQPADSGLALNWQELLKSAGLEAIAAEPLAN
jgi:Domain of Unknown Function (DUF928)